jgi:uncharacterized protein YjiS (DUF1127 family)
MSLSQAYASSTAGQANGLTAVFRSTVATMRETMAKRRERARAYAELESYSDRQLHDLGITRGDIRSIVDGTF